jgi:CheY-like chemotaxis protein
MPEFFRFLSSEFVPGRSLLSSVFLTFHHDVDYLPAHSLFHPQAVGSAMSGKPAQHTVTDNGSNHPPSGSGRARTVLVAEDEDAVRGLVCTVLEQAGFVVVAAPDGRAAAEIFAADPYRFDLLLTDVIMPYNLGTELAARVRHLRPALPVLFMSAFPGGVGVAPDPLPVDEPLLQKPFTVAKLLEAVRTALGA